jgi:hypothetical protein
VFGLLAGLTFADEPTVQEDGRSLASASLWMLGVAVVAWFAWVPVKDAIVGGDGGFGLLVLDALLASTWVFGLQSVLFSLVPMRYLDGDRVKTWSWRVWFAIYALGMFVFVHAIMHPQTSRYGGDPNANLASMLILFLSFLVVAVAFWLYFRLRGHAPKDDPASISG